MTGEYLFQVRSGVMAATRAVTMVGRGIYALGRGGTNPQAPTPFDRAGRCDCSGFVAWCWGYPREIDLPTVDWWNTDSLVQEARRGVYWSTVSGTIDDPYRVGDVIVYPGIDLNRDGVRDRIGHVGIITRPAPLFAAMRVVHCRKPKGTGPAVVETSGSPWAGKAKFRGKTKAAWGAIVIRPVLAATRPPGSPPPP